MIKIKLSKYLKDPIHYSPLNMKTIIMIFSIITIHRFFIYIYIYIYINISVCNFIIFKFLNKSELIYKHKKRFKTLKIIFLYYIFQKQLLLIIMMHLSNFIIVIINNHLNFLNVRTNN